MMELEQMPEHGCPVLAAVSGGADSVALLALLRDAASRGEIRLAAAHFEHGIRGEASREDARFVRALCGEWGVPLIEGAERVPALAAARGVGLEQAARDARHAFLRRAKEETGSSLIALAHHLDDQAETVLMHLLRGAGLRGAGGMRVREGDLWRPLLGRRKAELIDFLRARGCAWREDETNARPDNPRNILRLEAMPALERAYPGAARALGRFALLSQAEEDYMEGETRAFLRARAQRLCVGWRLEGAAPHPALARRVLRALGAADAASCLAAEALWRGKKGRLERAGGLTAERTEGSFYLLAPFAAPEAVPLPEEGRAALSGVGEIRLSRAEPVPRKTPYDQVLDLDALRGACLRTRRPGDFIRPLGLGGAQSLSDYFINRRIDRPLRDAIPLVARDSEVLWAVGVGISDTARLRPGSQGLRLEATLYKRSWEEYEGDV